MSDFTISVDIDAPPARVWAVMSDIERWHEWTPSVRRIRKWRAGPLAVGTRALIWQPRYPPALWRVTHLWIPHEGSPGSRERPGYASRRGTRSRQRPAARA